MKVLTEMELRAKWKTPEDGVYHVEAGTFVTPMAKDFLREKGVSMVIDPEEKKSMTRTPVNCYIKTVLHISCWMSFG